MTARGAMHVVTVSNVHRHPPLVAACLFLLLAACTHGAPFVWVDDLPTAATTGPTGSEGYAIRPGDVISVRVFGQEGMSGRVKVRADGHISIPFLNDVQAAGFNPNDLAAQLQKRLKSYVNDPVVTVALEESQGLQIPVLGEVTRPGKYALTPGSGVLDLLAEAGGLTQYARRDRIFVLRNAAGAQTPRIRFRYEDLSRGTGRALAFRLQPGDVVVVE